jgi:peptide/nickel transport system permease protein
VITYVAISIGRGLLTLLGVSLIVFTMVRISGNPLDILVPDTATAADRAQTANLWGLDRPYPEQYVIFLSNAVRGDFGNSFKFSGQSAMGLVFERLPATMQLAGTALLLSLALGVPLGVLSATSRGTWLDTLATLVAVLGQSLPPFWLALMAIWVFSVLLGWLPTSGRGGLDHMLMPCVVLGLFPVAALVRLIRASMHEVLSSEYVKLARLKGVPEWKVIWKHALKNAAIPPLTFFGTIAVTLLTGTVIIESIFSWPGIGLLALDATSARDFPVVQAVVLFGSVLFIVVNTCVDVLYAWVDPRVRLGGA